MQKDEKMMLAEESCGFGSASKREEGSPMDSSRESGAGSPLTEALRSFFEAQQGRQVQGLTKWPLR